MNLENALRLALAALSGQIQELEISANLYAAYHGTYPSGEKAYRRRERLRQAIQVIEDEINRRKHEVFGSDSNPAGPGESDCQDGGRDGDGVAPAGRYAGG